MSLNLGTCLLLDGVSQGASIPSSSAYSIPTTGALTISMWARPDADPMPNSYVPTGYVNFFGKNDPTPSNSHEWEFRWTNTNTTETNLRQNENDIYVFNNTGGLGQSAISQMSQYWLHNWIHYVATFDATYMTLYMNGELRSFTAGVRNYVTYPVTPVATAALLRVGYSTNNVSYWKGGVGPIKIWNRVLSLGEITRQYLSNETNSSGLVGSWTVDQANNRLTDSVSSNHGTLLNSPIFITGLVTNRKIPSLNPRPIPYPKKAMQVNGTTQYASIAKATQVGLDVGTGDFMVCFKAKLNKRGTKQTFIDMHDTSHSAANSSGATGWDIVYNTSDQIRVEQGDGSTTNSTSCSSVAMFDNAYHDIAVVSARTSDTMQIFIDGIKMINGSGGPTGTWTSNGNFVVGTREDLSTQFLKGAIGNIYFYKWTTIPADYFSAIQDLHVLGTTSYTNGLVSKWLMNGDGTDSYGPNNLTVTGSPSYSNVSTARSSRPHA